MPYASTTEYSPVHRQATPMFCCVYALLVLHLPRSRNCISICFKHIFECFVLGSFLHG